MGFFSTVGKIFNRVVLPVVGKYVPIVGVGLTALNLVAPKILPGSDPYGIQAIVRPPKAQPSYFPQQTFAPLTQDFIQPQGVQPMGLNVGGILGAVSNIFGGGQNRYFQGISNVANLASQFVDQRPTVYPVAQQMVPPTRGMVGPPRNPIMRGGAMVARGFFNRYPNLAVVIQGWRDRGIKVTRAQLWGMLKRWGPEILVSGGIITAASVAELMMAGPGHRRMNAGNAKALRRSLRRLDAFHRLCVRTDKYRGGSRRRAKPCKTGSGSQFVRQG